MEESKNTIALISKWQTAEIESEWGKNIITIEFLEGGKVFQENYFPREKESLTKYGTYEIVDGAIYAVFDEEGLQRRQRFDYALNENTLTLEYSGESYIFKRVSN